MTRGVFEVLEGRIHEELANIDRLKEDTAACGRLWGNGNEATTAPTHVSSMELRAVVAPFCRTSTTRRKACSST